MLMSSFLSIKFFFAERCCEFFHPGFCRCSLDSIDVGKTWITFLRSTLVTFLILMAQKFAVSIMQETSFQLILMTAVCPMS